jgi:hypothetical protein
VLEGMTFAIPPQGDDLPQGLWPNAILAGEAAASREGRVEEVATGSRSRLEMLIRFEPTPRSISVQTLQQRFVSGVWPVVAAERSEDRGRFPTDWLMRAIRGVCWIHRALKGRR